MSRKDGKILVRTEPELHRKAALHAALEGVSLSRWISRQIESAR
jgi:predicted HicB family RNase H-like nuclease